VYYNLGQESGFTETMLKENAIADITDVFDDELKGKLLDGILDGTDAQPYADGKIYLAPIFYTPTGFWYNKNLIGEGKQYELPTTWEEFFALGDQAKADGISLFTFPQAGYFDATMYSMLEQAGGMDFYNAALQYDENTWTSEEGQKVLDTIGKLVSPDYTQEDTVANANADGGFKINQQNVIDGKALFMPNGNWVIGEMAASTPDDFEWGMMPAPKWEGDETQAVYTFTEQMWIPADAPNMDLAKEFIKFMYSDTVVDILLGNTTTDEETGEESPSPVVAPVKGAADKLPEGTTKDCYAATTADDIVTVTGKWATTAPIEGLNMNEATYKPIESINTGDMTVEEWQAQLVETWEKCAAALE
ncbi:MAG: carbohydrate ABC transporter substrate-binding protein, partial [Blautia massiliensis (ex Durand et al. 2017)]